MENIDEVNVGDTITYSQAGEKYVGTIRYIGKLDGVGNKDTLWSDWGEVKDWSLTNGKLTYIDPRCTSFVILARSGGPLKLKDILIREIQRLRSEEKE